VTHTLHRRGTRGSLANDYVVLAMSAKGINEEGSAGKLQKFLEIAQRHNPVNIGDMKTGNTYSVGAEKIMADVKDTSIVHAVFTDLETVARFVQEAGDANLGMSVVISGLFDSVRECCQNTGLTLHTVEHSLGIWGRTERLAPENVLEVTTMCGHGMVAVNLVVSVAEDVKAGRLTPEDAARELTKQCCCGIFNPERGAELLRAMASYKNNRHPSTGSG